eukprot:gene4488-5083_t
MDQSMLLIAQAMQALTFHRRRAVLASLARDKDRAQRWLKEKYSKNLQTSKSELFGHNFMKAVQHDAKSVELNTMQYLQNQSKRAKQPFHGGSTAKPRTSSSSYVERPSLKQRPQKRILCSEPCKGEQEICKIPMGGESLRIHIPSFRAGPSPKNLHKNTESPSDTPEETTNHTSNLHRRHADSSKVAKRNRNSKGHNPFPLTKPGVPHKLGKIYANPKQNDGIPRNKNKLRGNDFLNSKPEDPRINISLPKNYSIPMHNNKKPCQHNRQTQGDSPSILTSPPSSKISPKSSEGKPEIEIIRITDSSVPRSPSRAKMVEGKPNNPQCTGETTETPTPRNDHSVRCNGVAQGGWGAATQGMTTGGAWTQQEKKLHINILEMMAAEMAIKTFTKGKNVKSIHLKVDNMTALHYILKMGGTKNMTLIAITKRIWEYLLANGITLTVEYIPSKLKKSADWESRNTQVSSE